MLAEVLKQALPLVELVVLVNAPLQNRSWVQVMDLDSWLVDSEMVHCEQQVLDFLQVAPHAAQVVPDQAALYLELWVDGMMGFQLARSGSLGLPARASTLAAPALEHGVAAPSPFESSSPRRAPFVPGDDP